MLCKLLILFVARGAPQTHQCELHLRVADEPGARKEAAHGVPEQEIGALRPLFSRQAAQLLDVRHHGLPAAEGAEIAQVLLAEHALAVAQVVVGHHHEAL